jgi:hypothetical protein
MYAEKMRFSGGDFPEKRKESARQRAARSASFLERKRKVEREKSCCVAPIVM